MLYKLILKLLTLLLITGSAFSQQWKSQLSDDADDYQALKNSFNEYWKDSTGGEGSGWKYFKQWDWMWKFRLDKDGKFPNAYKIYKEFQNFKQDKKFSKPLTTYIWKELGPKRVPTNMLSYNSGGAGRINCIRFNPQNEDEIYVGSSSGGLWYSKNAGQNWETFPFTQFLSIGIQDIAIYPKNPKIIYAATGDFDGNFFTHGYCIGIIKTCDGGKNWEFAGMQNELEDYFKSVKIIVNDTNPDCVLFAASNGIFKTCDGGKNWDTTTNYFKTKITNIKDFKQHPVNHDTLYFATSASFYRSMNNGKTWTKTVEFGSSRTALATTPAAPNNVYVVCSNSSGSLGGVWLSTDCGKTWCMQSETPNILGYSFDGSSSYGQGWYNLAIAVSPTDANEIYVGGINVWHSTDCGVTWNIATHYKGSYGLPFVHDDQHELVFSPISNTLFSSNDGGIYRKDNDSVWTDLSNGLAIAQFYKFSTSERVENLIVGGTQDNGTNMMKNNDWYHIYGGDGMEAMIDNSNPDIVYCSIYNGYFYRSDSAGIGFKEIFSREVSGESGAWISPIIQNPLNSSIIYAGHKNIWRSNNRGEKDSWYKISNFTDNRTINCLAVSPSDTNVIYVLKDYSIYRTTDGGQNWTDLVVPFYPLTYLAVSSDDPLKIWATIISYNAGQKVLYYDGSQWTNISGDLLNVPVNCVVYEKNSPNRIYIANDIGVFYQDDYSNGWQLFGEGLPNVMVNEIEISYNFNKLRAATFGRGVWEIDLKKTDVEDNVTNKEDFKIYPNPANGVFYIENNKITTDNFDISIFNSNGQIVYTCPNAAESELLTINLENQPNGTYFIRITHNGNKLFEKEIVLTK